MKISHELFHSIALIAIASVSTACTPVSAQPITEILRQFEESDNAASIEEDMFRNYEAGVLLDAVIDRLSVQDSDLSLTDRDRLWEVLARAPGDDNQWLITRLDRVQELEVAFIEGRRQTKIEILNSIQRISPELRSTLLEIISDSIPVETSHLLVLASIDTVSRAGGLTGIGREYVLDIAQDLGLSNQVIHNELFYQEGPAVGRVTPEGQRLQASAIGAGMLSQPEFVDTMAYVLAFDDNNTLVVTAMARAGQSDLILLGKSHSERSAWLSEYTRRFCLDSGTAHRSKYSIAYYMHLYEEYEDMDIEMCESFYQIQSSCTQDNFRGYGAVIQSIETMCGG